MVKTPPAADVKRCPWCTADPLYRAYHDTEWGVPTGDERALFERLVLEGMQAGLSWLTVLRKREHMRRRFFEFDPHRLAAAGEDELADWLTDPGLIRHRGKLESMIGNARVLVGLDGGFGELVWSFVDGKPQQNRYAESKDVPAFTPTSGEMAKTLKKSGFSFVGPTTCYAFMQSVGMVNDHLTSCEAFERCGKIGSAWTL